MSNIDDSKLREYVESVEDDRARLQTAIARAIFQLRHGFPVSALRTLLEVDPD